MHRMFRLRQSLLLQLRELLRLPEPLRELLRLPELLQLREYLRLHAGARAGT